MRKVGRMKNDLISRADAIDEAEEWIEAVYCGHDEQRERDAIKHVINGIKKLPSAQPDIVRCKDCKFAHITYGGEVKYCDIWFPEESHYMDTDNFCSFAERQEE